MAAPALAPKVKVLGVEAFEQPFTLRMPFRFGVITVTEGIQAFLRVHVRLDDGREGFGYQRLVPEGAQEDDPGRPEE